MINCYGYFMYLYFSRVNLSCENIYHRTYQLYDLHTVRQAWWQIGKYNNRSHGRIRKHSTYKITRILKATYIYMIFISNKKIYKKEALRVFHTRFFHPFKFYPLDALIINHACFSILFLTAMFTFYCLLRWSHTNSKRLQRWSYSSWLTIVTLLQPFAHPIRAPKKCCHVLHFLIQTSWIKRVWIEQWR